MANNLAPHYQSDNNLLLKQGDSNDTLSRIERYLDWLNTTGQVFYQSSLSEYQDYLLHDYTTSTGRRLQYSSIETYLATIRGRINELLRDNRLRDYFLSQTPPDANPADRKAYVDEHIIRLQNSIASPATTAKPTTIQDYTDSQHLRLSTAQQTALVKAPGMDTIRGIRDTAILAFLLSTGLREAELCGLTVSDLRKTVNNVIGVEVRVGKGSKQRFVPYGDYSGVLPQYIEVWLSASGIQKGSVFRGFYRGGGIRATPLTTRSLQRIVRHYPIVIEGNFTEVRPHDLRRTYAHTLWESEMNIILIAKNLGHSDTKTTLHYIGDPDMIKRKPVGVPDFLR
jgi:integrase